MKNYLLVRNGAVVSGITVKGGRMSLYTQPVDVEDKPYAYDMIFTGSGELDQGRKGVISGGTFAGRLFRWFGNHLKTEVSHGHKRDH